jgi:hypothetical protein
MIGRKKRAIAFDLSGAPGRNNIIPTQTQEMANVGQSKIAPKYAGPRVPIVPM